MHERSEHAVQTEMEEAAVGWTDLTGLRERGVAWHQRMGNAYFAARCQTGVPAA